MMRGAALLEHVAYALRYHGKVPFDFVVEYDDAALAEAWSAPIVSAAPSSVTTTAEAPFKLAVFYVSRVQMQRLLVKQIKRILTRDLEHVAELRTWLATWNDETRAREARQQVWRLVDTLSSTETADLRAAIAVRDVLGYRTDPDAAHILFNAGYAYALLGPESERAARALQFGRRAVNALRQSAPAPTWERLFAASTER